MNKYDIYGCIIRVCAWICECMYLFLRMCVPICVSCPAQSSTDNHLVWMHTMLRPDHCAHFLCIQRLQLSTSRRSTDKLLCLFPAESPSPLLRPIGTSVLPSYSSLLMRWLPIWFPFDNTGFKYLWDVSLFSASALVGKVIHVWHISTYFQLCYTGIFRPGDRLSLLIPRIVLGRDAISRNTEQTWMI